MKKLRSVRNLTLTALIGILGCLDTVKSPGTDPPPDLADCLRDADCDDNLYCTGHEMCGDGVCIVGSPPCAPDETCDESTHSCLCGSDAACDDGIDCTTDACVDGGCISTPDDTKCPQDAPTCVGTEGMFSFPIATSDCRGCCDRCRSQCELCTTCEERPLEEFPDFESARRDVVELMQQWMCSDQEMFPSAAVGQCADGMIVLTYHSGLVGETRFFRSDTEAFVALTNSTDCYEEVCFGRGYWPVRVECDSPIVTEVICGTLYTIGEAIPFF